MNQPWEGQKRYDDLTDQIAKMNLEIKHGQDTTPAEEDGQADLAEASFHSGEPQEPQAAHGRRINQSVPATFSATVGTTGVPMPDPCVDPCNGGAGMSDCACDVRPGGIRRRTGEREAILPVAFSDIGMPAREPDGTNRKVFPSKMAEAEEIRSRIETIKDLSDRLAEQDRTIKDLEEEMRSENAGTSMVLHEDAQA